MFVQSQAETGKIVQSIACLGCHVAEKSAIPGKNMH